MAEITNTQKAAERIMDLLGDYSERKRIYAILNEYLPEQPPPLPTIESIQARAEELYPIKDFSAANWTQDLYSQYFARQEERRKIFIKGATELSSAVGEGAWIDVKELPEKLRDVIICLDDDTIMMGSYDKKEGWFAYWADKGFASVIPSTRTVKLWRNLPKNKLKTNN